MWEKDIVYEIRRTTDVNKIKKLHSRILSGDYFYYHSGNAYWVLLANDFPVGFCIGTDIGHKLLYLSRSGIFTTHRGKGLQKKMIQVREKWGRRNNLESSITYCLLNNPASINSLISSGYRVFEPDYAWAGRTGVVYLKKSLF